MKTRKNEDEERVPVINIDQDIVNADWTKQVWDLPPVDSPAFARFLRQHGLTKEQVMQKPTGQLPRAIVLKAEDDDAEDL